MRPGLLGFLIGYCLIPAAGLWGQDGKIPPRLQEEIGSLVAEIVGTGSTDGMIRARDRLALIGTVAEPTIIRNCRQAGQRARWGLIQTLALTGGEVARRYQVRSLQSRALRGKTGCICLHALGIRHSAGTPALVGLLRHQDQAKGAWLRICGFLGLSMVPGLAEDPAEWVFAPAQLNRLSVQEQAAYLLLLCRAGTPDQAGKVLPLLWPESCRTWSDRLLRRSCVLTVAAHGLVSWQDRVLGWLKAGECRNEDYWACGLALGATGASFQLSVMEVLRARPRAWAGFLSLAAAGPRRGEVLAAAQDRLQAMDRTNPLFGAFAGALARSVVDDQLPRQAFAYRGPAAVVEVLRLELARRILAEWSLGQGRQPYLQAADRNWSLRTLADRLLVAGLAARNEAFRLRVQEKVAIEQGPGWGILAKALRGEVPARAVLLEVQAELIRLGAADRMLLDLEQDRAGRMILLGHSIFFRRTQAGFAPTTGQEVEVPKGAPSAETFYEQLQAFLKTLPLYLPPSP